MRNFTRVAEGSEHAEITTHGPKYGDLEGFSQASYASNGRAQTMAHNADGAASVKT